MWPLPLPDDYRRLLDSEVADLRNVGTSSPGGALTAGLFLQEFVADGLLVSEGEVWRRRRRLIQPAFHRERLKEYADAMVQAATQIADRWEPIADTDATIDLAEAMGTLTLLITARVLFGVDLSDSADAAGRTIAEKLGYLLSAREDFLAGRAEIMDLVSRFVDERIANPDGQRDVVSMLIEARDEAGESLTREQIHDEVLTLLLAGHETTANGLAWTWVLLMANPDAMDRVHAEVRDVLGGHLPTARDLSKLRYTKMAFQESLRTYPPAWIIGRRAIAEDRLGEHVIPAVKRG